MSQKRTLEDSNDDFKSPRPSKRLKLIESTDSSMVSKIDKVIRREFYVEICKKEEEIYLIHERLDQAKWLLDRLRACVIASYYGRAICQQASRSDGSQPTPIHPTVKRLLGKTVRQSNQDSANKKPTHISSSDLSLSFRTGSSGSTSAVASRVSSASSLSLPSTSNESATAKRWNSSKITKRIVVGNVSKYLAAGKKDTNAVMRYKWMVYVQGYTKEERDISQFVDKVIFMLDESYRPNDVITVTQAPFTLKRHGWGEFPVRVQLHFKGSATKCIDIIHELKLDKTHTGWTTLGAETAYDVNVDSSLFPETSDFSRVSPRRRSNQHNCSQAVPVSARQLEPYSAVVKIENDMQAHVGSCDLQIIKSEPLSPGQDATRGIAEIDASSQVSMLVSPVHMTNKSPAHWSSSESAQQPDHTYTVHVKHEPASPEPSTSVMDEITLGDWDCQQETVVSDSGVVDELNGDLPDVQLNSSCETPIDDNVELPTSKTNGSVVFPVDQVCISSSSQVTEGSPVVTSFQDTSGVAQSMNDDPVTSDGQAMVSSPFSGSSDGVLSTSTIASSLSQVLRTPKMPLSSVPISKREDFISCRDTSGRMLLIPRSLLASVQVASSGQALSANSVSRPAIVRTVTNVSTSSLAGRAPLTLSVGLKNSTVIGNTKEPGPSTVKTPPVFLTTGVRGDTRNIAGSVLANSAPHSGNLSVVLRSGQLTRGQFFTSAQGQKLFMPLGARSIERTPQSKSVSGSSIIIRPASSSTGTRLQASASSVFVLPELRKSLSSRPVNVSTISLPASQQTLTRAAVGKSPPVYLLVENSSTKTAVSSQQGPVQFLVATQSETPIRMSLSEIRAGSRSVRPTRAISSSSAFFAAGNLASRAAVRPAFASSSPLCFSLSNGSITGGEILTNAAGIVRTKQSGKVSLLRTAQLECSTSLVRSPNPAVLGNSMVLSGGKTFATKIGGQTIIVDMVGSTASSTSASLPVLNSSRSLVSGALRPTLSNGVTGLSSQLHSSKEKAFMKSPRESFSEKKTAADVVKQVFSSLNKCESMEDLVRHLVRQYPLFAPDIDRSLHPYCAPSWDAFLSWNLGKRRAAELCRAKTIQDRILWILDGARCFRGEQLWSRRQIIRWCRRHLYTPLDNEMCRKLIKEPGSEITLESSVTPVDPLLDSLESSAARQTQYIDSDTEIDIIEIDDEPESTVKKESFLPAKSSGLVKEFLPMSLEGQFVHETMDRFGIRPNPVQVEGYPCMYASSVEEMIARTMKLFVDNILRGSASIMFDSGRNPTDLTAADVHRCLVSCEQFDLLTNKHTGVTLVEDELPDESDMDT